VQGPASPRVGRGGEQGNRWRSRGGGAALAVDGVCSGVCVGVAPPGERRHGRGGRNEAAAPGGRLSRRHGSETGSEHEAQNEGCHRAGMAEPKRGQPCPCRRQTTSSQHPEHNAREQEGSDPKRNGDGHPREGTQQHRPREAWIDLEHVSCPFKPQQGDEASHHQEGAREPHDCDGGHDGSCEPPPLLRMVLPGHAHRSVASCGRFTPVSSGPSGPA
jgi:hypothetical protein